MSALLPHSALRLLSIMKRQGLLSVRITEEPAAQVPAILRRPSQFSAPVAKVRLLHILLALCGMQVKSFAKRRKRHWGLRCCTLFAYSFQVRSYHTHPAASIH